MKITKLSQIFLLLLISSFAALVGAYISQYIFDYQPCILCLYQRKPFFAIIAISAAALFFAKSTKWQKLLFFSCLALLAINFTIASYHVGVEKKIFRGPTTCSSTNLNDITDLQELEAALKETKAIRCDEPSFFFLGLTMAAWNSIFCLGLLITLAALYKKTDSAKNIKPRKNY